MYKKFFAVILLFTIISIFGRFIHFKQKSLRKINVILIIVDSLRPDHMSCYGYKRLTTPKIDNFAKSGVIFSQVIAQGPHSVFSLPSIMTSNYLYNHIVLKGPVMLNPQIFTLAEILKNNNYQTVAICGASYLRKFIFGIERGFDSCIYKYLPPDKITQKALDWLKGNLNKPFFLWLHYYDPHYPYRPPSPYNKLYLSDNLCKVGKQLPLGKDEMYPFGVIRSVVAEGDITDVDYYISQYDGEINFVDEQIGILLDGLNKLKLDKDTLIIITADHGEFLGEHNIYFTHETLYDTVLKIPLIIKFDKVVAKNRIINYQVQAIDIMPTILDILKIKNVKNLQGVSLFPSIIGKKICATTYAFAENTKGELCIRTKDWKLIYQRKFSPDFFENKELEYELYNLKSDPMELNNLANLNLEKFEFLKQKLDIFKNRPKPVMPQAVKPLDEETYEELRSLGYLR